MLPKELGNRVGIDIRIWFIDIFAKTKSQRDDFSYRLKNELQNRIPVFDYDEGFPPDVSPTQLGTILTEDVRIEPVQIMPQLVKKMYFRAKASFVGTYTPI